MHDDDMDGGRLFDDEAEEALNTLCSSLSQRGADKVRELLAALPAEDDAADGGGDDDSQRIAAERHYKATKAHHVAKDKARKLEERKEALTKQVANVEWELEQQYLSIDRLAKLVEDTKLSGSPTIVAGAPAARAAPPAAARPADQAHGARATAVAPGAAPGAAVAAVAASATGAAASGQPTPGTRPRRPGSAGKHAPRSAPASGVRRGALKGASAAAPPAPAASGIGHDEELSDDPSEVL